MMNSDSEGSNSMASSGSLTPLLSSSENRVILIGGHNIWEWMFLFLSIPNVIVLLVNCSFTLQQCIFQQQLFSIGCILEIEVFIVCGICLVLAIYGVFAEYQYEIYLHSILLLFAIVISVISSTPDIIKQNYTSVVFNGCALILWLLCATLGIKATTAHDWTEFRLIGVSDPLAAMYKQVCYFLAVLKFDMIFMVSVSIYATFILYSTTRISYILWGLVILYSLICWTCGKAAVLIEDMYLSFGFVTLSIAYPAFVLYQCYELMMVVGKQTDVAQLIFCYAAFAFELCVILSKFHLIAQMKRTWQTYGYGLNTRSFQELVTRDSTSLFAHSRSALVH